MRSSAGSPSASTDTTGTPRVCTSSRATRPSPITRGGIVTVAPGVPIQVGDVAIDPLLIAPGEKHLEEAIESPVRVEGIPLAPVEAILYLKLKSPRRKDAADMVALLTAGVDVDAVRAYLERHGAAQVAKFELLAADAAREEAE